MLKQDLCWIFVRSDSFETLFEFCQLPGVGIGVVSSVGIISTRITDTTFAD